MDFPADLPADFPMQAYPHPHGGWPGNELEEVLSASLGVPSAGGRIVEVLGRSHLWIPLPNGGGGADTFVFETKLGSGNVDHITDFAPEDTIRLVRDVFKALAPGVLPDAAFKDLGAAGAKIDADDRILYDRKSGALFYDADGLGKGAAVQFAVLDNKVAITAADFLIV